MDEEQQRIMAQHAQFAARAGAVAEKLITAIADLVEFEQVYEARGYATSMTDETLAYSGIVKADIAAMATMSDVIVAWLDQLPQNRRSTLNRVRNY